MASEASTSIPGCALAQPREQRRADLVAGGGRAAEPQRAEHAAPGPRRVGERRVDRRQRGAAVGEQPPPGLGQLDVAGRAHEQLDAELGLELPDRLAERRRGHVQPVGRAREAELLGDRDEVPQMAQLGHADGS